MWPGCQRDATAGPLRRTPGTTAVPGKSERAEGLPMENAAGCASRGVWPSSHNSLRRVTIGRARARSAGPAGESPKATVRCGSLHRRYLRVITPSVIGPGTPFNPQSSCCELEKVVLGCITAGPSSIPLARWSGCPGRPLSEVWGLAIEGLGRSRSWLHRDHPGSATVRGWSPGRRAGLRPA